MCQPHGNYSWKLVASGNSKIEEPCTAEKTQRVLGKGYHSICYEHLYVRPVAKKRILKQEGLRL